MVYHDRLKDLDFPDISVAGNVMPVGCTGEHTGVDAISHGGFTKFTADLVAAA